VSASEAPALAEAPGGAAGDAPEAGEMLLGFWYRALATSEVARGKTRRVTVLDRAVLVGRDARGQAFALYDACPHRGMPLSHGRFDGETIQCGLHGWRFDVQTGACRLIPACTEQQRLKVGAIRAGHIPCEERDDFIWVYLGEGGRGARGSRVTRGQGPEPWSAPAQPVHSPRYRSFYISGEVATGADYFLSLLVDPAHGPYVHRRWWVLAKILFGLFGAKDRNGQRVDEAHINYAPIPFGFRETLTTPVPDAWSRRLAGSDTVDVEIDFLLPTVRVGTIRFGKYWLSSLHTITPINKTRCRVDQRVAWYGLYWMPFGTWMLKTLFWIFFAQDRTAMERQAEGVGRIPRLMFVDDFDRPARWYYEIKRAFVESRRDGSEFRHPMSGPVTLKWRNAPLDDA
jgi:phenylpropionate dioxygenase-like ring-hydroxylating dioxygenase large terminal subunit